MRHITFEASTWYDAGLRVGYDTRDEIRHVDARLTEYLAGVGRVVSKAEMLAIAEAYLLEVRDEEPRAYEWLRGLASGAMLPLPRIALIAFSEEISASAGGFTDGKCSTIAVETPEGRVIAHNEDYEPHYLGRMHVLDMRVGGGPRVASLNYPGQLPHACALNERGVVVANNSLWPEAQPRLSNMVKHFRASLSLDADSALLALTKPAGSLTSHYTVADARRAWSVEVSNPECAARDCEVRSILEPTFVHTNHALYLCLHAPDPAVENNNHTLARYAKLLARLRHAAPKSADEAMALMSANDGVIHRTAEQCPTSVTNATVVISLREKIFRVRGHGPGEGEIVIRL